jgi:hypothetical protein
MVRGSVIGIAALAALMAGPAPAAGLLGIVGLGGGNDNLVNIEIGGDSFAHVNTGGALAPVVDADVRLLGQDGVANVQVDAGGRTGANLSVGNGGLGACVSVLSGGCGDGGTGSRPGAGGPGKAGATTGPGGGILGTAGRAGAVCASPDDQRAVRLLANRYDNAVFSGWARAKRIQLVLVQPCPDLRAKLGAAIKGSAMLRQMQRAAADDALIAATLDRNGVRVSRVLGVDGKGGALSVYVY